MSADRQTVYLEEDCDYAVFLAAKIGCNYATNEDVWTDWFKENEVHEYQENTFVRNLNSYALKAA